MSLSDLLVELRKHLPHVGIVSLNGDLAIITGYKYPANAAEPLRLSDMFLNPHPSDAKKDGETNDGR